MSNTIAFKASDELLEALDRAQYEYCLSSRSDAIRLLLAKAISDASGNRIDAKVQIDARQVLLRSERKELNELADELEYTVRQKTEVTQ